MQPQIIGEVKHGRPAPRNSSEPEKRLACDMVIVAIGQGIETREFEKQGIPVKRGGDRRHELERRQFQGYHRGICTEATV